MRMGALFVCVLVLGGAGCDGAGGIDDGGFDVGGVVFPGLDAQVTQDLTGLPEAGPVDTPVAADLAIDLAGDVPVVSDLRPDVAVDTFVRDVPPDIPPPPDRDDDGVPDDEDAFPDDPNEWLDSDGDGVGNNADPDDDEDGVDDEEELVYGDDCVISNPLVRDTDNDGLEDPVDPYPRDAFPEFLLTSDPGGRIFLHLSNRDGSFRERVEIGQELDPFCAPPDGNCSSCASGTHCELGSCVADYAERCESCPAGTTCRVRRYNGFSIADFDGNGQMDFLAHTHPVDADGRRQLWFFYRLIKEDEFAQVLVGEVDKVIAGVVADVNDDARFDIVAWRRTNISASDASVDNVVGEAYLNVGDVMQATCAVGAAGSECVFEEVPAFDLYSTLHGQWTYSYARETQDITGDGHKDLVFSSISSGGNVSTPVSVMPGVGDGTFATPQVVFTHNSSGQQSPAQTMLFADFTSDGVGDVIMGCDDDGDPGQAWLYEGLAAGGFDSSYSEAFDLNASSESGSDDPGASGSGKTFDFDFDGNLDVIIAYRTQSIFNPPSRVVIYLGNGDGTFQAPLQIGPELTTSFAEGFQTPQRLCPWWP